MKTLAEVLKNETNTKTIFAIIFASSKDISNKVVEDEVSGEADYSFFSEDEIEDISFIRCFNYFMKIEHFVLAYTSAKHDAEESLTAKIDAARLVFGLPREKILWGSEHGKYALPHELAYLIKTGVELRRWLRTPEMAVAS